MDVASGTLLVFVYRVLGMVFMAGIGILTARVLGQEGSGIYGTTVIVIYAFAAVLSSFSATSGYFVSNRKLDPRQVVANGLVLSAIVAVLMLVGGAIALLVYGGSESWLIYVVVAAVIPFVLKNPIDGVFLGENRITLYSFAGVGHTIFTFVAMFLVLVVFGRDTPEAALIIWVVMMYVMLAIVMALGPKWWQWLRQNRPDPHLMREFLGYGTLTGLATFVGFFNYRIDQLMVAGLDGAAGAGVYMKAVAVAEGVWMFSTPLAVASFSRVGGSTRGDSARLVARSVRHVLLIVSVASAGVFILAPWIIRFLYTDEFSGAINSLRVLCLGTALFAPASLISAYFSVQLGRPAIPLALACVSVAANVVICLALVPQFGYIGAAWATTISYGLTITVVVTLFLRMSEAEFSDLWRIRRDDLASYLRLGRRVLRGDIFRTLGGAASTPGT